MSQQRPVSSRKTVIPTEDQQLLRNGTTLLGGRWGRQAGPAVDKVQFFTLPRILILLTTVAALAAVFTKQHCLLNGAGAPEVYFHGCYSDWTALYGARGLADDPWAPFSSTDFEYPVLMSFVASLTAALLPPGLSGDASMYWGINFIFAYILWVATVILTAKTARWRPWDAAMVAIAPGIIFAGSINWDMWAVALLAAAMWAASRGKPVATGIFIGLGAAMKLYPLFLLGALLVLAWRQGRNKVMAAASWKCFGVITGSAAGAWLIVNIPLMIGNWEAFLKFYTFSSERGASWSSIWHIWNVIVAEAGGAIADAETVGVLATGLFALSCLVIFIFGISLKHPPRLAQLMFLIVAAFILFNKVYSPQFVIWLIPLVALANPRWIDFIVWQVIEVLHFWAVWMMLARNYTEDWSEAHKMDEIVYVVAVLAHVAAVLWLMLRVIKDMLNPELDPVRQGEIVDPGYGFKGLVPPEEKELSTSEDRSGERELSGR